jgi:hypothetical protein
MRTMLLLPLVSCAHSGLGQTDETSGGTGSTGDTGPTSVQDCPWVGTWNLAAVRCNTFAYGSAATGDQWYAHHDDATMEIDNDPAGGCDVVTTITGATCTRTEAWTFSVPVGITVEVDRGGITACDPDACTFDPGDAVETPCSPGDLDEDPASLTIDGSVAGSLTAVGLIPETGPDCVSGGLDLITTWRQGAPTR